MRHSGSIGALLIGAATASAPVSVAQGPDAAKLKQEAFQLIDAKADWLGRVGDAIFSYSELGYHEVNTVKLLTGALEQEGFRVERGVAGMPTAYRATYGSGSPVIGVMADFDCVPGASQVPGVLRHEPVVEGGPGHGEGHNTNPPTVIGAALALKDLMAKYHLPGTIIVYGGPAEELGGSRGYMINAGLFKGVDAIIDAHVGSDFGTSYGLENLAIISLQWTFHGVPGHGSSPWTAKSALDAVELMDAGMNWRREHLPLDMRFHYVISYGGEQPNVVPEEATVWYYLRQTDYEKLLDLLEVARGVARGATEMTATTVTERILAGSWPLNGNKALAELLQRNVELVGMPKWSAADTAFANAFQRAMGKKQITGLRTAVTPIEASQQGSSSSDVGDVTWNVPYARLRFPSNIAGTLGGHHWSAAIAEATPVAHKGIVVGAKAVAGTLIDLFTNPRQVQIVKDDFATQIKGVTWKPLLPPGSEPPVYMNGAQMAKWAPLLAPHYYDPSSPKTLLEEWGIPYPPPAVTNGTPNK